MSNVTDALTARERTENRKAKGIADAGLVEVQKTQVILAHIANKWSVLILTVLCSRPSRFNEIKRRLDGITHKSLADALKRLERNGLIRREVLPTMPVGVEYTITPFGQSLQQPFAALYDWALKNGPELERAQAEFDLKRDELKSDNSSYFP